MAEQQPVSADGTLVPHQGKRKKGKTENTVMRKGHHKKRKPPKSAFGVKDSDDVVNDDC